MVYYMYDKFYNANRYTIAAASGVIMFIIIMLFTFIQLGMSNRKADQ